MRINLMVLLFFVSFKFLHAAPLITRIQNDSRVTVNWESQKLKFYGVGDEGDFRVSEKGALREGLVYLNENVSSIQTAISGVKNQEKSLQALQGATNAVYTLGTTYFTTGGVRIDLETRLARVLLPQVEEELSFSLPDEGCRVVNIYLSKPTVPQAFYEISTPSGKVYDYSNVDDVYLSRNLMGRWHLGAVSSSAQSGGKFSIKAKVTKIGEFMVSEQDWGALAETCELALKAGSVALVVPI